MLFFAPSRSDRAVAITGARVVASRWPANARPRPRDAGTARSQGLDMLCWPELGAIGELEREGELHSRRLEVVDPWIVTRTESVENKC
jgi:hypothetical protein